MKPHILDCIHHWVHSYTWSHTCFQQLFFLRCRGTICLAPCFSSNINEYLCNFHGFVRAFLFFFPNFLEVYSATALWSLRTIRAVNFCCNYVQVFSSAYIKYCTHPYNVWYRQKIFQFLLVFLCGMMIIYSFHFRLYVLWFIYILSPVEKKPFWL